VNSLAKVLTMSVGRLHPQMQMQHNQQLGSSLQRLVRLVTVGTSSLTMQVMFSTFITTTVLAEST
jgi:hypothetical protein